MRTYTHIYIHVNIHLYLCIRTVIDTPFIQTTTGYQQYVLPPDDARVLQQRVPPRYT